MYPRESRQELILFYMLYYQPQILSADIPALLLLSHSKSPIFSIPAPSICLLRNEDT